MADNYFEQDYFEQDIPSNDQLDIQLDTQQDSQVDHQQQYHLDSQVDHQQQQYQQDINEEGDDVVYLSVMNTPNDGLITTDRSYYR